ncbi:unnamed protein product, partial [Didymodactylos carnosus]
NIAAGKTTVLNHIQSKYPNIEVKTEPIDHWTNVKGFNLLEALYTQSERWTFTFEFYALLCRVKDYQLASNNHNNNKIKCFERSLLSNKHVFIRHAYNEQSLNEVEYELLNQYFEYALTKIDYSQTAILFLDLIPEQCYERLIKRARDAEKIIDLKRLEKLHHYYDDFLKKIDICEVKRIDAAQPVEDVFKQVDCVLDELVQ